MAQQEHCEGWAVREEGEGTYALCRDITISVSGAQVAQQEHRGEVGGAAMV